MNFNIVKELDGLSDACGVFGCVATGEWPTQLDLSHIICLGLVALQHRGQESAGIVMGDGSRDNKPFSSYRSMGLVNNVFTEEILAKLKGNLGIGHNRYSTAGKSEAMNCQPFIVHTQHGRIAIAHNGELINGRKLRKQVLDRGVGLSTQTDSELLAQLLSLPPDCEEKDGPDWPSRIRHLMKETPTAYALLLLHEDAIYAIRDPFGNRPLCIGRLEGSISNEISVENNGSAEWSRSQGWVVSSESCAFQSIGAKYYREVEPGEIVHISKYGIKTVGHVNRPDNKPPAVCIFEYVYFLRPDTVLEGQMVYSVRVRCGEQLAVEAPVQADIVSTVPESATPAALGYSRKSGVPYTEVLCKNRYVGRTFIQPSNRLRQLGVAKKFGALTENFEGKRIVLVDDSIVRGNTIGPIIRLLREAGAKEVHIRVASPPIKHPCYMGINIPTHDELIANKVNSDKLAEYLGANSVVYLSVDGLLSAVQAGIISQDNKDAGGSNKGRPVGHCTACLTGKYPVHLDW